MKLRLVHFRPSNRPGPNRGLATVEARNGLLIHMIRVFEQGATRWIVLPSRPRLDASGLPMLDEEGRPQMLTVFSFTREIARREFEREVLAAVERAHPEAFDGPHRQPTTKEISNA